MTRTRLTGLSGALFGVAMFLLAMFGLSTPNNSGAGAPARFESYWQSSHHQSQAMLTAVFMGYLSLLLIAFFAGLAQLLRSADGGPLPRLVAMLGTVAGALLGSGIMLVVAIGVSRHESTGIKVDGSTALIFDNVSYLIASIGLMAASAAALCTALVTLRTVVLPRWTAWLGFVVTLPALGSVYSVWADFILLPVWTVVLGAVLLLRNDATADGPGAPLAT